MAKRATMKPVLVGLNGGVRLTAPKSTDPAEFDELIAHDAHIHMEMMDEKHLWCGLEAGGRRYMINIWPQGKKLMVRVEDDGELPCRGKK